MVIDNDVHLPKWLKYVYVVAAVAATGRTACMILLVLPLEVYLEE